MLATLMYGKGDVRVEQVPDAALRAPGDVVVQVEAAAVCGSDLDGFTGAAPVRQGSRMGHEFIGRVVEVGREVHSVASGDLVLAPLNYSDGTCAYCREGLPTSCPEGGFWGEGTDGGQGEAVRVPYADHTLVALPHDTDPAVLPGLLAVCDVLPAGYHAARLARVRRGSRVAIVGDGAIGLSAVLAARRLGAERIVLLGRHQARIDLARAFGATDIVVSRSQEQAVGEVRELTAGGVDAALDCFGSEESLATALGAVRDGCNVALVGVPPGPTMVDVEKMIFRNLSLHVGVVPARTYMAKLLPLVLSGELDPSPMFDLSVPLNRAADGYAAMADRSAVKALITVP